MYLEDEDAESLTLPPCYLKAPGKREPLSWARTKGTSSKEKDGFQSSRASMALVIMSWKLIHQRYQRPTLQCLPLLDTIRRARHVPKGSQISMGFFLTGFYSPWKIALPIPPGGPVQRPPPCPETEAPSHHLSHSIQVGGLAFSMSISSTTGSTDPPREKDETLRTSSKPPNSRRQTPSLRQKRLQRKRQAESQKSPINLGVPATARNPTVATTLHRRRGSLWRWGNQFTQTFCRIDCGIYAEYYRIYTGCAAAVSNTMKGGDQIARRGGYTANTTMHSPYVLDPPVDPACSQMPSARPSVKSLHCCINSLRPLPPAALASTTSLGNLCAEYWGELKL